MNPGNEVPSMMREPASETHVRAPNAAMLDVAARQLGIGLSVIADSLLGYAESYTKAVEIGHNAGIRIMVLECECSDQAEWRRRIEQWAGTGLAAHHATDSAKVGAFYEPSCR